MSDLNPFPDYAVVRLQAEAGAVHRETIVTPAIKTARSIVSNYSSQWLGRQTNKDQQIEPIITAVRGDYGTGKTHLLLDADAHLKAALLESYPDLRILRIACKETSVSTWFRLSIGPELKRSVDSVSDESKPGFIETLMLRFYAAAGREVAARTNLTEGAVEKLRNEPAAIRSLVKQNLLNVSAVDDEFSALLQRNCPEASENVRRALACTVWIDTASTALRWLAGETLTDQQRRLLRVSQDLSNEEEAAGVLLALAAAHKYLETPLVFMFDELEHLTRYDQSQQSKRNITWLKRLLEGLAVHQTLTFVSGHWSAWEAQNDYLDRFSQLRPIELVKLTADDVIKIVSQRVPAISTGDRFSTTQAQAIVQSTDGNIRRVLTLCRVLFKQSNGFTNPLTPEQIQSAAVQLGQRITPEDAAIRIRSVMEDAGLVVRTESATESGVVFDLIGYQGNRIRAVVDVKHAIHQADQHDQAKVFLDRVQEVYKTAPDVVACFLADGNVDDDLLALLNATRPFKLLWFDLTKADVMTQFAQEMRANLLNGSRATIGIDAGTAQLSAQKVANEEVIAQLEDRIRAASANANAGLVNQLQEQRMAVKQQLDQLNGQLAKRDQQLREEFLMSVRAQVDELDQKRSAELKELYERLESERQNKSLRDEELLRKQEGEEAPKLSQTYAELTRATPIGKKLRMAMAGPQLLVVLFLMIGGIVLALSSNSLAAEMARSYSSGSERLNPTTYVTYQVLFYSASLTLIVLGPLFVWLRLAKVERFLDYSSRTLREVYLRSKSVQDLVKADSILRDSLETFGLLRWKGPADEDLWRTFDGMVGRKPWKTYNGKT